MEKAGHFGALQQQTRLGPLGYGMPDPNITATADSSGHVNIDWGGRIEQFTLQPDGSYLAPPGDFAVLTLAGGVYQLTQPNGILDVFNPNGTLNYIQTPNGDRLTYNYTGGLLTSTTDAFSGDTTTFAYDANNRIVRITDPQGRVTTLTYDSTDTYLQSIANARGTTSFAYANYSLRPRCLVGLR